jgi:HEAT repeat protein
MSWLLPPLTPNFEAALRDVHAQKPELRVMAAERLGNANEHERPRAQEALTTLLRDPAPQVRSAALLGLGALGDRAAVPAVVACFGDPACDVRELAALIASQLGGQTAVESLRGALTHTCPEVRFQAVAGLSELDPDACVRDLVSMVADPDPEVRAQIAAALGSMGQAHLAGHLARLLEDEAASVRVEAALALASLGDARSEPVLLEALGARLRLVEVVDALSHIRCQKSRDALGKLALAFFTQPHVRAAAGAALVRLGDARGVPALRRALTGLRGDARSFAASLAADVGAEALVPDLVRLSRRPRGADPVTIIDALGCFAKRSPQARAALQRIAERGGELGAAASRALLNT